MNLTSDDLSESDRENAVIHGDEDPLEVKLLTDGSFHSFLPAGCLYEGTEGIVDPAPHEVVMDPKNYFR